MQAWEKEFCEVVDSLKMRLNLLKESGMTYIPKALDEPRMTGNEMSMNSRNRLDNLRQEIGDCKRCKLCTARNNIVFGIGNPSASLVFVGEGPGAEEDKQGEPFVGRAG